MSNDIKIEYIPPTGLTKEHLESIELHGWGIVKRRLMTREQFEREFGPLNDESPAPTEIYLGRQKP